MDSKREKRHFPKGIRFSVRQVLDNVKEVSGIDFKVTEGPRRECDPPSLVADARRIRETLHWEPKYQDIKVICQSAFNWEKNYKKKNR